MMTVDQLREGDIAVRIHTMSHWILTRRAGIGFKFKDRHGVEWGPITHLDGVGALVFRRRGGDGPDRFQLDLIFGEVPENMLQAAWLAAYWPTYCVIHQDAVLTDEQRGFLIAIAMKPSVERSELAHLDVDKISASIEALCVERGIFTPFVVTGPRQQWSWRR